MKRKTITLEQVAETKNLMLAFHKAVKGKRYRDDVQKFLKYFDANINQLGQIFASKNFRMEDTVNFKSMTLKNA